MGPRVHRRVYERKLVARNIEIRVRTRISRSFINLLIRIQLPIPMPHHLLGQHAANGMRLEVYDISHLGPLNLKTVETFGVQSETGRQGMREIPVLPRGAVSDITRILVFQPHSRHQLGGVLMLKRNSLLGRDCAVNRHVGPGALTDIHRALIGGLIIVIMGFSGLGELVRMDKALARVVLHLGLCCFELISLCHGGLELVRGPFHFKF